MELPINTIRFSPEAGSPSFAFSSLNRAVFDQSWAKVNPTTHKDKKSEKAIFKFLIIIYLRVNLCQLLFVADCKFVKPNIDYIFKLQCIKAVQKEAALLRQPPEISFKTQTFVFIRI
jgi:hypothetical protein